jgi:hypothetical protein
MHDKYQSIYICSEGGNDLVMHVLNFIIYFEFNSLNLKKYI